MTYTPSLGCAKPSLMQKCKFAPLFYHMHNTTFHPFFAKTIGGPMGLLSCGCSGLLVPSELPAVRRAIWLWSSGDEWLWRSSSVPWSWPAKLLRVYPCLRGWCGAHVVGDG